MRPRTPSRCGLARQRGVAIITALLLTTLAITIVTSLFWQQQVQVRSMENQRLHLQTKWILLGAIDYARFVLRQDLIYYPNQTTLDGVWSTPLAETRLDQYIERERIEGETFDATLSGQITDAQARYNLHNLVTSQVVNEGQVTAFGRLLTNLQLDPNLAQATAQAMRLTQQAAAPPATATGAAGTGTVALKSDSELLEFVSVDDLLSVKGFSPQSVERLRPFVTVLPVATALNVNTAPAEVLAAVVGQMSVAEASALAVSRKQAYFKDLPDFTNRLNGKVGVKDVLLDVKSSYFLITSQIRLDRAALDAQALVRRDPSQTTTLVSIQEN